MMRATRARALVVGVVALAAGAVASTGLAVAFGDDSGTSAGTHAPYELKQITPNSGFTWRDADGTFAPLPSGAKVKVDLASAKEALGEGLTNTLALAEVSAQPTAGLYNYTNDQYGQIQDDGSVKLEYVKTPVWLVRVPLSHPLTASVQQPYGATAKAVERSGCTYYYIVDATTGDFLTSGQHCDHVADSADS